MPRPDRPQPAWVFQTAIVLGAVNLLLLTTLTLTVFFAAAERERQRTIMEDTPGQAYPGYVELRDRQMERISTYRVIDEEEGLYAIPIDLAVELVVSDLTPTETSAAEHH